MEKNNLKDGNSIGGRSATNYGIMIKDLTNPYYSWENTNINISDQLSLGDGGDLVGGFSWPPRSYTCTFCKREFRSAQALGGHMNVHRKDRARLRQMTFSQSFSSNYTLLNLNLHPNPNPNLSPSFSSNLSSTTTMLPPLISSSSSSRQHNSPYLSPLTIHPSYRLCPRDSTNLTMIKSQITSFRVCNFDSFRSENEGMLVKESEIVRLNLEIGSKCDDVDLELRLGCA